MVDAIVRPSSLCVGRWARAFILGMVISQPAAAGAPSRGDDSDRRSDDPVLSASAIVAETGKSIEEWGAAWWQWAFENPDVLSDPTGEFGSLGDVGGPVFFATGSNGDPVHRSFKVPANQFVLLPIATYVWTFFDPCAEIACARTIINRNFVAGTKDVELRVDGRRVPTVKTNRVVVDRTPTVFLVDAGPIGDDGYGGILSAVQGGYWAMLEPLSPGVHRLEFGATVPDLDPFTGEPLGGTLRLQATLDLTVERSRGRGHH
jgi:hypothetical protein